MNHECATRLPVRRVAALLCLAAAALAAWLPPRAQATTPPGPAAAAAPAGAASAARPQQMSPHLRAAMLRASEAASAPQPRVTPLANGRRHPVVSSGR
jgi:hypothetical protein